ncbi:MULTISPECIES: cation diffusion facilitator family transporter [Halobacteriales]|jgi:cobalt-zinc-cadmium efflux system protein|uniref:Cation efflux system protein n=4 Tax=Halobacteriales TaxID=2235 RepID=Q5V738_HALMA|nr:MULTISPECIES: cation diffusion facilitator family transporter [Halobacteria]AAV44629.1 cation efflux system protein [Haloarcula marismortui ATCC 43049]EMA27574.1 cation efflux system protein [Haloarcula japonica DSM 6131]KAB7513590.1 cation diffusion facilitator family transporter [Halosegnis rubeus]QCP89505.1 cation transporter [Haloarcula marismortui ATCC 43049]QZY04871.1 cation diffusion facilitator family transporter [Halobaculum roseum]
MTLHEHTDEETAEHNLPSKSSGSTRRLALVAVVNFFGFVIELAGGLLFGSVALISDALHMLFDMLAYAMAFGASYTAERFEGGEAWSYGLHRLEPVAAFLNGVLLLPMVGYIVWESYQRFLEPVAINPELTLIIATGGLLVNIGSVYVLQGGEMSLNERGAFYHLLGDAGGSVAVIVSTAAVAVFDLPIADPVAAVLIGLLVLASAGNVLRESTSILLERSPVSSEELRDELTTLDGVDQIEDLHVWQVCSQLTVATVRLTDTSTTLEEQRRIQSRVHDYLTNRGIDHATVELVGRTDPDTDPVGTTNHSH